ncbi:hypothetical protein CSPAE12_09928 [Colletotrichum incanum]|nr:hypothetical protein CSPAE12_09928 [Colletotrichum incanum]
MHFSSTYRDGCLLPKGVLILAVAGLCVTGIIFVTDFFEVKKGHGGFIPRLAYLVNEAIYDPGGNKHHGTVQPEEWCKKHLGDCNWADSQVCGSSLLAPGEVIGD